MKKLTVLAVITALAMLAGCDNGTTEYVEVETSHESVFKDDDGNDTVYLSFTDTAYKIVKDKPGQLAQFKDYINEVISHANYSDYFKGKTRLDVFITDFTYNSVSHHTIGTGAIVINVRYYMNNNDIADSLISEFQSGISSMSDYSPPV
jgi:hypothetical protein